MPELDRRITIVRTIITRDQFGETVETHALIPVWATRRDISATDTPTAAGQLNEFSRAYTIRWRRDLIEYLDETPTEGPPGRRAVLPSQLAIRDPDLDPSGLGGNDLSVDDIETVSERGPLRERRRFIRLVVLGEAT